MFCPGISFVNPQLPWPVCQCSKDFLQRIKSVGANERAAFPDCVFLESWQTKCEKPGLFALYMLQVLEITLICCNVILVLYQIKLFIFTLGAVGQNGVNKSLLLLLLIYSTCCVFVPVVTVLGDVLRAASGYFADCWAHNV